MFNCINIEGRLTADAEMKQLPSGTQYLKFDIATDKKISRTEKETYFYHCKSWQPKLLPFLLKGVHIIIAGELRSVKYNDKTTQQPRDYIYIEVRTIDFLPNNKTNNEENLFNNAEVRYMEEMPKNPPKSTSKFSVYNNDDNDDMPF